MLKYQLSSEREGLQISMLHSSQQLQHMDEVKRAKSKHSWQAVSDATDWQ